MLFRSIRELVARRELLYMLIWRETVVRYKQSIMGLLWAVLMPILIVGSGFIIRYAFSRVAGTPLALADLTSVAVKAAPWAFFVAALRFGTNSLVANSTLVTKIFLPRLVFPVAAVCAQLFDFLVAGLIIGLLLLVLQAGLSIYLLWLPILIAVLVVMACAFAVIFAAASLFFRDVKYLVDVLLTFAIFFTPVFYESSLFGNWAPVLLVNPVSPLLEAISATVVLHRSPSLPWIGYSVVFTVLLSWAALAMFSKLEPLFAESV
jgi:ABC-type polysaccharide/polyol phosphate export permease